MWRHDSGAIAADLASVIVFVMVMAIAMHMDMYHDYGHMR